MEAVPNPLDASIQAESVAADLQDWLAWMKSTHPDLTYSTDLAALDARAVVVEHDLSRLKTRGDAWAVLAQINPVLADAHLGLRLPQRDFETYLETGGAAFPTPVTVRNGRVLVAETISETSELNAGDEIVSVNGQDMSVLIAWMQLRLRGEDDVIRERILTLRFPLALWTYIGGQPSYEVIVRTAEGRTKRLRLDPDQDTPTPSEGAFAIDHFGDFAILTADTFQIDQAARFQAFLKDAFETIAARGTSRLIIDLRDNGGGAHDVSDLLMSYLTDEPFSATSEVFARITPENQGLVPGSTLGDVMRLPFKQTVEPPAELSDRFAGEVWIWIGPNTYSQAIAFAATAQDHGIAQLVGQPTSGRANQTGQTQRKQLDASGFSVQSPIYVFTRSSGDQSADPLQPDLRFDGEDVDALIAAIQSR